MVSGMILDVLLERMTEIDYSQTNALNVKPVRRFQENVVTDIVSITLIFHTKMYPGQP